MRQLFKMTNEEIDRAVEAYTNRLLDRYEGNGEPDPCCKNCRFHSGTDCCLCDYIETNWKDEEHYPQTEDDDYCDHYEVREDCDW